MKEREERRDEEGGGRKKEGKGQSCWMDALKYLDLTGIIEKTKSSRWDNSEMTCRRYKEKG
jgi:hypothetical protein